MWISFGSVHEVRAFRERKRRRLWFRELVENCVVFGDRCYRGCEGVFVCDSREMWAKRQVVEGVISQIKLFNAGSRIFLFFPVFSTKFKGSCSRLYNLQNPCG